MFLLAFSLFFIIMFIYIVHKIANEDKKDMQKAWSAVMVGLLISWIFVVLYELTLYLLSLW